VQLVTTTIATSRGLRVSSSIDLPSPPLLFGALGVFWVFLLFITVNNVPDSISSSDLEQLAQQRATRENIEQRVAQRNTEKLDFESLNDYGFEQIEILVNNGVYENYRDQLALAVRALTNLASSYKRVHDNNPEHSHSLVAYTTVLHAIRSIDHSILD
jgi:hypothetical protein